MKSLYGPLRILGVCLVVCGCFLGVYFSQKMTQNNLKDAGESLEPITTLTGKLCLKCFRGPPDYSSEGDEVETEDPCWVVELDESSFLFALNVPQNELSLDLEDILKHRDARDLALCIDENHERLCKQHQDNEVAVRGVLFHAHTHHHPTPLLMVLEQIICVE